MRFMLTILLTLTLAQSVHADAWDEVCEWRRRARLPAMKEDPALTKFAMMKARYRAERGLQNGHQGPRWPKGCTEGTGEAKAMWGWLTCVTETDAKVGGAGMCIGRDGQRYMVLVVKGHRRSLIDPHRYPIFDTSRLSPHPPRVGDGKKI